MRLHHLALLPLSLALLTACSPQESATPEAAAAGNTPAAQPAAPADTSAATTAPGEDADFPTLSLRTLDGQPYDLASHRGRWVVINFWATWCKPCVQEMPDLSALDTMRENIDVLGLAYDDSEPEAIRQFLQAHPVAYPIAIVDPYEKMASFAPPRGLPTTYLIAPDGRMAKKFMGPVTASDIEGVIAAASGPGPKAG